MGKILIGKPVVQGSAEGAALVSKESLSFWGGISPQTGEVIDRRHDRSGYIVTGKVFVFPTGKGSSTSSATLMESIRTGVAPAAIINLSVDPILALGSIVADELYHQEDEEGIAQAPGHDHRQEGIDPVQPVKDQILGDHDDLIGKHHGAKHTAEQELAARKLDPGESVGYQ